MVRTKTTFYPFETIRDHLDNLWYDFHNDNWTDSWTMPIDLNNKSDRYTLKAWLPGINKDELDIEATKRTITIKGRYMSKENDQLYYSEIPVGNFQRKITLPTPIEKEHINAQYLDGILTLNV